MKKQRFKKGSLVKIQFNDTLHTYGRLLEKPYITFYDAKTSKEMDDVTKIASQPVLFTVSVYDHAITSGRWQIIGHLPPEIKPVEIPLQFMQDPINPNMVRVIDEYGNIRPSTLEECSKLGLERAAVWEPEHVEERIDDYYKGKPNTWVESLKLKV